MSSGGGMRVYRIQDAQGRGPFKPGMPAKWADEVFAPGMRPLLSWMEEFGADLINRLGLPGEHFGSAVRTSTDLHNWFSQTEMEKLSELGYRPVALSITRILAESPHQIVFARRAPLHKGVLMLPWPARITAMEHSA